MYLIDRCQSMVLTSLAPPLFTGQHKAGTQVCQSVYCAFYFMINSQKYNFQMKTEKYLIQFISIFFMSSDHIITF